MPVIVIPVCYSEHVEAAIVHLGRVDLTDLLHKIELVTLLAETHGMAAAEWNDEQYGVSWAGHVHCFDEEMTVTLENGELYVTDGRIPKYEPANIDSYTALVVTPTGIWWKGYDRYTEVTTEIVSGDILEDILSREES